MLKCLIIWAFSHRSSNKGGSSSLVSQVYWELLFRIIPPRPKFFMLANSNYGTLTIKMCQIFPMSCGHNK